MARDQDSAAALALRDLRGVLRTSLPDTDSFVFHLSTTLDALGLSPTSVAVPTTASTTTSVSSSTLRAASRYMSQIQHDLVRVVPTFLPALDARGRTLLETFFCPPRTAGGTLPLARSIAYAAYLSLTGALLAAPTTAGSSTSRTTPARASASDLAPQARAFVLATLEAVVIKYPISELYWAVWSSDAKETVIDKQGAGARALAWDDAVRAAASVPVKVANAVGRWRGDTAAAIGEDVPPRLVPKAYFDTLVISLEALMYELSLSQSAPRADTDDLDRIRAVLEKLVGLGLITSPSIEPSRSPSLLGPMLPRILDHLHPSAPLQPYPPTFFPSLLLPLPTSTLFALTEAILAHVPFHLTRSTLPLEPDVPDQRILRAASTLTTLLGPPVVDGEAWQAVLRSLLGWKRVDDAQHARRRLVVAWAGSGGDRAAKSFIDTAMETWTDPKYVKFGLYAQQFHVTHVLVLAISLLPEFHPHLIAVARRPRFIHAMQSYLSHPDGKIRRLGMLVAEIMSDLTIEVDNEMPESSRDDGDDDDEMNANALKAGLDIDEATGQPASTLAPPPRGPKRLKFSGLWDGTGDGKEECRWLRRCVGVRDDSAALDAGASLDDDRRAWMLGWEVEQPGVSKERVPGMVSEMSEQPPGPAESLPERTAPRRGRRPKIVMLDDDQAADPLEGYAPSSPSSSRSPSPTPSFLAEVTEDPTLALDGVQKPKAKRPVYVRQLVELLRDKEKADSIEMALAWGEGLVRSKRLFGTELVDNAVDVATATIGLSDPFHLDDFEQRRQGLLTALVACSPRNVPTFLTEQYFGNNYSLQQKWVMLTAIAMGARELAGLPVPDAPRTTRRIDFATKTLPPALHRRYISRADAAPASIERSTAQIDEAAADMRNLLISKGARKGEETVPSFARERRLRVGPARSGITELDSVSPVRAQVHSVVSSQAPVAPYMDLAAEFFVLPLINRFWQYFQDSSVRETRAVALGTRYRGAGTGLVLSPSSLEKFLMTLALLVHAARHSPLFLAVIAPEALELAVTVGARYRDESGNDSNGGDDAEGGSGGPSAQVSGGALELALAVLDTVVDLDAGRTLAQDQAGLVLATGEWAQTVFDTETGTGPARSRTAAVASGSGGMREGRVRAAAAGVVVKVAEIGDKWATVFASGPRR